MDTAPLFLNRMDGGTLVLHVEGIAARFFAVDPSSVGAGSYDSLAGRTTVDRIEHRDVEALNRTMRARSPHDAWDALLDRPLSWLEKIPADFDLVAATDCEWRHVAGDALVRQSLAECVGRGRGVSVATKMLHLKRPRLFPVLDSLVAQMLGATIPTEGPFELRVERATEVTLHLRREGRRNLDSLTAIQRRLAVDGVHRSIVRILDAALWLAHPAAGTNVARSFEIKLL